MIAEMKKLVRESTNAQRLEIASQLEKTAAEIREVVQASWNAFAGERLECEWPKATDPLTPAEQRFYSLTLTSDELRDCVFMGMPVREFAERKGLR